MLWLLFHCLIDRVPVDATGWDAHREVNATTSIKRVSVRQLVGLYRAADVMLMTPLRDGMNLVAKEFVASRVDEDGVLMLSEFAGAAAELDSAVVVNPYDVDGVAEDLQRALSTPPGERQARMKSLRGRVAEHDVFTWADKVRRTTAGDAARPSNTYRRASGTEPHLGHHVDDFARCDGCCARLWRTPTCSPTRALMRRRCWPEVTATAGSRTPAQRPGRGSCRRRFPQTYAR